jgi:hypothetical protein
MVEEVEEVEKAVVGGGEVFLEGNVQEQPLHLGGNDLCREWMAVCHGPFLFPAWKMALAMLCEKSYIEIFQCSYLALPMWKMLSGLLLSTNLAFAFPFAFSRALALPLCILVH